MGKVVVTAGVVPVAALAGVVGSASERLVGMATLAAPPVSRCFVPVCVPSAKLRFIKCEPDPINGQRDTWRQSTTCLPWLPAKSWMAGAGQARP